MLAGAALPLAAACGSSSTGSAATAETISETIATSANSATSLASVQTWAQLDELLPRLAPTVAAGSHAVRVGSAEVAVRVDSASICVGAGERSACAPRDAAPAVLAWSSSPGARQQWYAIVTDGSVEVRPSRPGLECGQEPATETGSLAITWCAGIPFTLVFTGADGRSFLLDVAG